MPSKHVKAYQRDTTATTTSAYGTCEREHCRKKCRYVAFYPVSLELNAVGPHRDTELGLRNTGLGDYFCYVCAEHLWWLELEIDFRMSVPW